jgi:hypothetical protein
MITSLGTVNEDCPRPTTATWRRVIAARAIVTLDEKVRHVTR